MKSIVSVPAVSSLILMSASAAAAEVTRESSSGATFTTVTELTCDDGSVGTLEFSLVVNARSEVAILPPGEADDQAFVDTFAFDSCTQQFEHHTRGLPDPSYEQRLLRSARLTDSFEVTSGGELIAVVDVDLEISGTGSPTCTTFDLETSRGVDCTRDATVDGSVRFDGEELIESATFASLRLVLEVSTP